MTTFKIVEFNDGEPIWTITEVSDEIAALETRNQLAKETFINHDEYEKFVYDGTTDLVIFDTTGKFYSAWNRSNNLSQNYEEWDYNKVLFEIQRAEEERLRRPLAGFQIFDKSGSCIHGTPADPYDLKQNQVFFQVTDTVKEWIEENGFEIKKVYKEDLPDYINIHYLGFTLEQIMRTG